MTSPGNDPLRDQLAEAHEHDWTGWVRPAVLRDSFGVVIDSAGVAIRRLTGTDQPVTPAWWRTCRTCPSEESAFPAAEVEARVQAAANQRATDVETATREHFGRAYAPPGGPIDAVTKLAQASFRAGYVIGLSRP